MENHAFLCMNCFAAITIEDRGQCPVCGWDNSKAQVPEGLSYNTLLNNRYQIGRVKAMNGEGITYSALDSLTKKVVEIREFYPLTISSRESDDNSVNPFKGQEFIFEELLDDFTERSKNVGRVKEVTVIHTLHEIFEENFTAYAVYEYVPAITLRRYVEMNGVMSWNQAQNVFLPVLTALGLLNSLGIPHLGISPETIKVTMNGGLLITGFSIGAARRTGTPIMEELYDGCAAVEQYTPDAICGEMSDIYAFAATLMFAISGVLPMDARKRLKDERLMIAREYIKDLPPYAVTALANALQVKRENRTTSFARLKTEISAAPTVVTELNATTAIRRLPSMEIKSPQNKGLPPFVWLIGTCVVTLAALIIIASIWMKDSGKSFTDIAELFSPESNISENSGVPNMLGEPLDEWEIKVENGEYHFMIKVTSREFSDTVAEGNIISQSPAFGEPMSKDNVISVVVSRGSATRVLPEIKGFSFVDLSALLEQNSFTVIKEEEYSEDIALGYVIRYKDYEEGHALEYGETITLIVSKGPEEQ